MRFLYLGIFLIPLIFNPFGFHPFGIMKVVWFLVFVGVGLIGLAWKGKFRMNKKVLWYLLGWMAFLLLNVLFSVHPVQSFFGDYMNGRGVMMYLFLIVHFLICWQMFREKEWREKFFGLVKGVGVVVASYAIVQWFFLEPEFVGRVYGTLGQPNFLAQILIFPFFLFVLGNRKWWEILGLILVGVAIYLTGSRAVMLAVGVVLWLMFLMKGNVSRWVKASVTLAVAVLFLGFVLGTDMRSVGSRWLLWLGSLELAGFWGSGVGSFYREFVTIFPEKAYMFENFYTLPANAHNETLNWLVEGGVVGMVFYLIPIGFLIWAWKEKMAFVLLAYYISMLFGFSTVDHFVYLGAFRAILLVGVLKDKVFKIGKIWIVFGLFALLMAFGLFMSDVMLRKGVDRLDQVAFENAVHAAPMYAFPAEMYVRLYEDEDYLDTYGWITGEDFKYYILANEFEKAMVIAPNLPEVYLEAGDYYYENGDCENAVVMYEKLKGLAPEGYDRLFLKHAPGYVEAMEKMKVCQTAHARL